MNHKIVDKKWGYEIWIENNNIYCGKHLHIAPGKLCSVHYHKIKKETFYIINGSLLLELSSSLNKEDWENNSDSKTVILNQGESITIEPFIAHRFRSATKWSCDFIEISSYHDDNDSYRIIDSI